MLLGRFLAGQSSRLQSLSTPVEVCFSTDVRAMLPWLSSSEILLDESERNLVRNEHQLVYRVVFISLLVSLPA